MEKDKRDLRNNLYNNNENNALLENLEDEPINNFFHIFCIDINELWDYFKIPSFFPIYFFEKCKIINSTNLSNKIKINNILELQFEDKNINIKIIIEEIIDSENFKSFTLKSIEVPNDISPFSINISLYMSTATQKSGVNININSLEPNKNTFIYDYILKNHKNLFQNVEKIIENNYKEIEQAESISIEKSSDEVWDFFIKNNYSNLKILLGNNASVKATNIPNEIEVEHFTKNNFIKIKVSKKKEYNEKTLLLQILSSTRQIPKQTISIIIININKNSCLLFFTHKLKQFLNSNYINNYSLVKKKTLWLLKTTVENDLNI